MNDLKPGDNVTFLHLEVGQRDGKPVVFDRRKRFKGTFVRHDDMTAPAAAALAKMVFTGIGARDPEQPRLPRPTIPKLPRR